MIRHIGLAIAVALFALMLCGPACATEGIWNLAGDFHWSPFANPDGQWAYGWYDSVGNYFYNYDVSATEAAQGTLRAWHPEINWDDYGNCGINEGPSAINAWGRYQEVGQIFIGGAWTLSAYAGVQWTCPENGEYKVYARFTGQGPSYPAGATQCRVAVDGYDERFNQGLIGFIGTLANNFTDGSGPVREQVYRDSLTLYAGQAIVMTCNGPSGAFHRSGLDARIYSTSALGTITGKVTSSTTGNPLNGATVATADGQFITQTDPNGDYTIPAVPGDVTLNVSRTLYVSGQATATVTAGATVTKNITLDPELGMASGTVMSAATGAPISGAIVQTEDGSVKAGTNASGSYSMTLPAGTYTLVAKAGGFAQATNTGVNVVLAETTTSNFALAVSGVSDLKADFTTGPVCNPSGVWDYGYIDPDYGTWVPYAYQQDSSYPGLRVAWHAPGLDNWDAFGNIGKVVGPEPINGYEQWSEPGKVTLGFGGSTSFCGVQWTCPASGSYKIKARLTGQTTYNPDPQQDFADISITVNDTQIAGRQIAGFIGSEANEYADGFNDYREANYEDTQAFTAGDTLRFLALSPDGPRGRNIAMDIMVMQTSVLGTVSGKVTSTADGSAVQGVWIVAPDSTVWAVTNEMGDYTAQVPAGTYTLKTMIAGYVQDEGTVTVVAGGSATLNLEVSPPGFITGRVTSTKTGDGIQEATITDAEGNVLAVSDEFGYYTSEEVRAGTALTLTATAAHYLSDQDSTTVVGGSSVTVDFQLVPLGIITGTVTAGGTSANQALVNAVSSTAYAVTPEDGTYSMEIAPGTYGVTATKQGYTPGQVDSIAVTPGDTTSGVNFALTRAHQYDLGLDYSATSNPSGVWNLGYRKVSDGAWVVYDCPQDAGASTGSILHGWHPLPEGNWDAWGSIGLNAGPQPIPDWGRYQEVGQVVVQPSAQGVGDPLFENDGTGARWTCPETGRYVVHARFTAQSNEYRYYITPATVNVRKNGVALHTGIVEGFNGSIAANYTDRYSPTEDVTELVWNDILDLTAADTVDFVVWYPNAEWDAGRVTAIDAGISRAEGPDPTPVASIADLKDIADGTLVTITTPVVATAATGSFGSGKLYVEDTDRVAGIKVIPAGVTATVLAGDRLTLTGVVGRDANNDRCITAQSITVTSTPGTPIRALGIATKNSQITAGLVDGLLISLWGNVTARGAGYVYLDDGSGLLDGTGNTGIRVSVSDISGGGSVPTELYILATGILGHTTVGTTVVPTIYPVSYSSLIGLDVP